MGWASTSQMYRANEVPVRFKVIVSYHESWSYLYYRQWNLAPGRSLIWIWKQDLSLWQSSSRTWPMLSLCALSLSLSLSLLLFYWSLCWHYWTSLHQICLCHRADKILRICPIWQRGIFCVVMCDKFGNVAAAAANQRTRLPSKCVTRILRNEKWNVEKEFFSNLKFVFDLQFVPHYILLFYRCHLPLSVARFFDSLSF